VGGKRSNRCVPRTAGRKRNPLSYSWARIHVWPERRVVTGRSKAKFWRATKGKKGRRLRSGPTYQFHSTGRKSGHHLETMPVKTTFRKSLYGGPAWGRRGGSEKSGQQIKGFQGQFVGVSHRKKKVDGCHGHSKQAGQKVGAWL